MSFDQFRLTLVITKQDTYDVRVHVDGWKKSDMMETSDNRTLSPMGGASDVDEWMTSGVTLDERSVLGLATKLAEEAFAAFLVKHAEMAERTRIAVEKHNARVALEAAAAEAEAKKQNSHLI